MRRGQRIFDDAAGRDELELNLREVEFLLRRPARRVRGATQAREGAEDDSAKERQTGGEDLAMGIEDCSQEMRGAIKTHPMSIKSTRSPSASPGTHGAVS